MRRPRSAPLKAVFDLNAGSRYADEAGRYHFESTGALRRYLETALAAVGDWIVYRESRRNGGRQAYVGVGRVERVEPDHARPGYHYAIIADYLEFPRPVPLQLDGRYFETRLREVERRAAGRTLQGHSMRPLPPEDFAEIVEAGLSETLAPANAIRLGLDPADVPELQFEPADLPPHMTPGFADTVERRIEQMLVNRKIRDANFRLEVCEAYDNTCAVTGLRMINGGGRAEVQAAHIKPVAMGGPDIVQNGIALSATVHWLFDRHLISLDEEYRLLVAHNRVPTELRNLFRPAGERIRLPREERLRPAPQFVAHHRELFVAKH